MCRSRAVRALPAAAAGQALRRVRARSGSPENLYAHLTRVQRGLIRVDADELTYPLHIMLRYELEKQLAERRAGGARSARGLERRHGAAPGNPSGRTTAMAACRTSTGRLDRSATFRPMRWARSSPRSCTRACATTFPSSTSSSPAASFRAVRLAAHQRAWPGRESAGAGPAEAAPPARPLSAASFIRYVEASTWRARRTASRLPEIDRSAADNSGVTSCGRRHEPRRTFRKLQAHLRGQVGKAIDDFGMIADGRPRHGVPVRRQGLLHAARHPAVAAAQRAGATSS